MNGLYVLYLLALLFSFFSGLGLAVYGWRKRPQVAATTFALFCFFSSLTTLSIILMSISANTEWAYFWARLRFPSQIIGTTFFLLLALEYAGYTQWFAPRRMVWLWIVPLLSIILPWTHRAQEKFLVNWQIERRGFLYFENVHFAGWYVIGAIYSYALVIVATMLFASRARRSVPPYRWQALIMFCGGIFTLVANLPATLGLLPPFSFNLTPIGIALRNLVYGWALFSFKLLDLMPIAHETLIENMHDGVLVVDLQNRVVNMNPAARRVLPPQTENPIGRDARTLFNLAPQVLDQIQSLAEGSTEIRLEHPTRYYEVQVIPLKDRRQKAVGRLITWRNITDRKQVEMEREQLVADLDAYTHTVAHDLKNPVGVIVGYSSLLLEDNTSIEVTKIHQQGRKLATIIDSLLLLAHVRSDAPIETVPLDMGSIVTEALSRLALQMEQTQAEIILPEQWLSAQGYRPWIEEVWANYLSNALKYGGKPPRIEVGAERQQNRVRFWVRDNGQGLTEDQRERLFKPFERLNNTKIGGHGLGLSIVQRILEKLNGEVGVTSEVGQGSTFYFTLPATDDTYH